MRFDKVAYFVKAGAQTLDTETGDYTEGEPTKTARMASVTDTSEQSMTLIYGKIKQGSLTIRIQNSVPDDFDYIELGGEKYSGKKYSVDSLRKLPTKETFIVSEAV